MMVAAYAMLGLKLDKGEFSLRDDAFTPKGDLLLRKVTFHGRSYAAKEVAAETVA